VPLTNIDQQIIMRSIMGRILYRRSLYQSGASVAPWPEVGAIARWAQGEYAHVHGGSSPAFRALAQRGLQMAQTAAWMMSNPDKRAASSRHGRDPIIQPGEPEYIYRVVVTVQPPGGTAVTSVGEVVSDTPLSATEIEARVIAQVDVIGSDIPRMVASMMAAGPAGAIYVDVTGAGRRP
jgi:hypothetical protein